MPKHPTRTNPKGRQLMLAPKNTPAAR